MNPAVSVIIPVYNSEPFLRECLDSVVNQTLRETEIICVNDGSTDKSPAMLEEYSSRDSRIKIINQDNRGAGAARNAGLKIAAGKYLSFLDSDDYFARTMLEKAYKKALAGDADIIAFDAKKYNVQDGKYSKGEWKFRKKHFPKKYPFSYKDAPAGIFKVLSNEAWTKIFKKDLIFSNGIQFQELRSANDVFFTWCAIFNAEKIDMVDEKLAFYRKGHLTSIQSNKDKTALDFYHAFRRLKDYLITAGKYEEIKQNFGNFFLSNALYNLFSIKDVNQFILLYNELKEHIFSEFEYDYDDRDCISKFREKDWILEKECFQFLVDRRKAIEKEIEAIRGSPPYRMGRMITWLPRKIKLKYGL